MKGEDCMNTIFALNLINAVAGKKVENIELDKDFLNMLDYTFSDKFYGLDRMILVYRFGQERIATSTMIAKQFRMSKDEAKIKVDSCVARVGSILNLNYFKYDTKDQRNMCYYFRDLLEPVFSYSKQIQERANVIHESASFDLNENDPFSNEALPDSKTTSYFVVLLDKLCSIDIEAYPENKLGCLCVLMSMVNGLTTRHLKGLVNREINCARAERRAGLESPRFGAFSSEQLDMDMKDIIGDDIRNISLPEKISKLRNFLAYEPSELAQMTEVENVEIIEKKLIAMSNSWKGYGDFWKKF